MVKDTLKIIGITISLSWISFILLVIFMKAIGILFNDFFVNNAMIISIVSGVLVFLLIIIGAISLTALSRKGKSIF